MKDCKTLAEELEQHILYLEDQLKERVFFFFPINLDRDGKISHAAVFFCQKGIYRSPVDRIDLAFFSFEKIKNARYESFQNGAACELLYDGEWMEFCRAFSSEKENISQLVRILKEVSDGVCKPEEAHFTYRLTTCPKCRRPLSRGTTVCNRCASKKGPLKKLWSLMRSQFAWIALSMLLFFFTSLMNVILPVLQRHLVDDYIMSGDPAAVLGSFSQVILVILSMAAVRLLSVFGSVFRNNILSSVSSKTVVSLSRMLYAKIQSLSVEGISRHTAGDLINRVSGDTNVISQFMTNHLPNLLEQVLMIIFVSVMMFSYSPAMALMILIPAPFVSILYRLIWSKTRTLFHRQWVENSRANTVLHDVFQGVREVKVYGNEKREIEKYDNTIRTLRNIAVRNETAWAKLVPYADYMIQIGNFILLYYAGNQIIGGNMTIGQMTMFSSFVSLIYSPLRWMANLPRTTQRAMTSINKIFEVLDEEPEVADRKNAKDLTLRGEIEVDSIWFGYTENENVLENISVNIKPGEMLGIVGRSGAGKSTLINLIMRLYDVNRGAIRIDGVDIRDITQHSLRSQIGVVLQETFLFAGTVYENIAYAKPDATYEEVLRASRLANAHGFIMKLADGYDTVVGERGYTLSGGERQRIAIARAILHDPKILILDEATSALDTETEKEIQTALSRLCKNRTTIAIAHRLSTLRNATKILVLDKKTVAEVGTHEELAAKDGGIYQSLVIAQREMSAVRKTNIEK